MSLFRNKQTRTTTLDIEGMTCANCVHHVTEALTSVAGVQKVHVDLETAQAHVEAREGTDTAAMATAVADAGYSATVAGA